MAPSTSTAKPVYSPSSGALQRTVPAKSVVSVPVNASSRNHDICPLPFSGIFVSSSTVPPLINQHVTCIASSPRLRIAAAVRIPPCLRRAGNSASRTAGPAPTPVIPTPGTL